MGGPGDGAPEAEEPRAAPVCIGGRQHPPQATHREPERDAAWSKTLRTSRNSMHENRETCGAPVNTGRSAKAQSQTADAYALQESDRCVLPVKQANKEGQPSAEAAEGRRRPKEDDAQSSTCPTQSGEQASQVLSGVRRLARAPQQQQFTALLHHIPGT